MQPYDKGIMNNYPNNNNNRNIPQVYNPNEINKPMNNPFGYSGNNENTFINAQPGIGNIADKAYNQNYYYQNQNVNPNQSIPTQQNQNVNQVPQMYGQNTSIPAYGQKFPVTQNNLNQNSYQPGIPQTNNITQSANIQDSYTSGIISPNINSSVNNPMIPSSHTVQQQYMTSSTIHPYSNINNQIGGNVIGGNNVKTHPNIMPNYDNTNMMNNVQETTTETYEKLFQFNAFPHFVRSSVNYMPANSTLIQKTHAPLGFIIQPLAPIPKGYPEIASVNFGNSSIVRCKKCRTYINPFVKFDCAGKKWNCNMCHNINDTPQFYYVPLDEKGKRKDLFQRPELCTGSVEFIAPSDYMIRPPQPPVYLFLIDVTVNSVNSGLLDIICNCIKKLLPMNNDINNKKSFDSRTLISIITFDSTIHFYNLNPDLKQPQMLVVPDLTDIFIPLPDDILVNAHECQNNINMLLDNLPIIWKDNKITDSCAGNAIKAAFMLLKKVGGKIMLFLSSIPNIGDMPVSLTRESKNTAKIKYKNIYGGNQASNNVVDIKLKEMELLNPLNNLYSDLAQSLTQYQILVDLFACPINQLDLATIYPLIKNSGGTLYFYPQFNIHQYSEKIKEEIFFALTTETAWESVMRIRISKGWKITNWYGNFQFRGVDLLALPNCHSGQAFSVIVNLEENVVQDSIVYVQSALLYTNSNGERRIRLHTYALPISQNLKSITESINPDVVVSLLSHQAIELSKKGKIADGRNLIQTICSQLLSSQMLLSDNAKLLAMYILGMLKSIAFRDSVDILADLRIYHWSRIENISVSSREVYYYPKMYALHNLENHHGTLDQNGVIILPNPLSLTCDNMTQDSSYLLEDGETMMMWIGRGINPQWIYAVFGVQSLDQINTDYAENHLGSSGNSIGIQVLNIINSIRQSRMPTYMRLIVIKQGDPLEHKFFASLIEDRSQYMMMSLKEFIAKICPKFPQFSNPTIINSRYLSHNR